MLVVSEVEWLLGKMMSFPESLSLLQLAAEKATAVSRTAIAAILDRKFFIIKKEGVPKSAHLVKRYDNFRLFPFAFDGDVSAFESADNTFSDVDQVVLTVVAGSDHIIVGV